MIVARFAASQNQLSEVNDQGALARFAPLVVENVGAEWRLGACADGPRRARVVIRQVGTDNRQGGAFEDKESDSAPLIVVRALIVGLARLRSAGAQDVTIVPLDKTLVGYLFRKWRVRSLAMHAALVQLMEAASGLRLSFEAPRRTRDTRLFAPRNFTSLEREASATGVDGG
jgi:hypothetical protein